MGFEDEGHEDRNPRKNVIRRRATNQARSHVDDESITEPEAELDALPLTPLQELADKPETENHFQEMVKDRGKSGIARK